MQPYNAASAAGPSQPYPSSAGALAAHAAAAALSNPYYAQNHFLYPQAAHYAQAYAQYPPGVTADGYTLSSTYVPGRNYGPNDGTLAGQQQPLPTRRPHQHGQAQAHWYSPGTSRCSRVGCSFTGSQKAVEIHMMDRHLIYPPGWEHRKRKPDWDADPSLKGKPIPIHGTSAKLDTPEAIAEWIAERKKRFPTASRVEDNAKKLEEAISRGQLPVSGSRFPQKRRRLDNDAFGTNVPYDPSRQEQGRGRGRGHGRGRGVDRGWQGRGERPTQEHKRPAQSWPLPEKPQPSPSHNLAAATSTPVPSLTNLTQGHDSPGKVSNSDLDSDSDSDSDGAPEVVSSKAAPPGIGNAVSLPESESANEDTADISHEVGLASQEVQRRIQPVRKPPPKQPRRLPRNPFASRPSLLRNLLSPEIRMTVSNLSQAIRFLVDNNFLENVELKPGQASEKLIEVVGSSTSPEAESTMQETSERTS